MKLSKNFEVSEFSCPCCGKRDISPLLIEKLQALRDRVDCPIHVTSGVRCKTFNKRIGGHKDSPHIKGYAADIKVYGVDSYILAFIANNVDDTGRLGIYPDHLHLDIVLPSNSHYWLVKNYGDEPIYSGKEKNLAPFLLKNKFNK